MSYRERNGLGFDDAATNDALKRLDTRRQERAARLANGSEQKARRASGTRRFCLRRRREKIEQRHFAEMRFGTGNYR